MNESLFEFPWARFKPLCAHPICGLPLRHVGIVYQGPSSCSWKPLARTWSPQSFSLFPALWRVHLFLHQSHSRSLTTLLQSSSGVAWAPGLTPHPHLGEMSSDICTPSGLKQCRLQRWSAQARMSTLDARALLCDYGHTTTLSGPCFPHLCRGSALSHL